MMLLMDCNTRCVFFCLFVFWQKWRPVLWMTEVMAYWIQLHWRIWLLVPLALDHLALAEDLKPTRWPLYPQKPLVLVWNAPTEDCRPRHNVHLQLDQFQIVASPNEGFTKQNLTMFYKDRLGLYPHFQDGVAINGGLPQIASLTQHREKMPEGIAKYIRDPSARGLAVIDWEEWRPIWIRNWDTKAIYKSQSQLLVSQKKNRLDSNPDIQSSSAGVWDVQPYIHAGDVTAGQKLASKPALGLLPISWLL